MAESYAGAIADAALAAEVDAIVAADEAVARVITGCIAAKGNVLITSNVNALRVEGDQVTIERGVAEGSSIQTLKAQRPAIALIGESVDEIDPGNEPASIQQIEVSVPDALTAGDYHAPEDSGINLAEAQRVVFVWLRHWRKRESCLDGRTGRGS